MSEKVSVLALLQQHVKEMPKPSDKDFDSGISDELDPTATKIDMGKYIEAMDRWYARLLELTRALEQEFANIKEHSICVHCVFSELCVTVYPTSGCSAFRVLERLVGGKVPIGDSGDYELAGDKK